MAESNRSFTKSIMLKFYGDEKSAEVAAQKFKTAIVPKISEIGESFGKFASSSLQEATKNSNIGSILANTFIDTISGKNALTSLLTNTLDDFSKIVSDAIKELSTVLDYSQLSSSNTRSLAFGYGFSSSEAYAWDKALKAVGLFSEEDLFYANQQEMSQFRKAFTKYSEQYTKLYDSGFFEELQNYQFEMRDFKNEMTLELMKFFVDNKDTIMAAMRGLIKLSEFVVNALGAILSKLHIGSNIASTADIISNYSNSSSSIRINNTFNGVAKSDESWLKDVASLSYEQYIKALGGN